MENQPVSTGPSNEPVVVSSNPSNTSQKGRPRTPTFSSAQFSDPMLNSTASTSSHTSLIHKASSQQPVNVPSNTSQNGSTEPSTPANPQYAHQKLDDISSNLSHVSSSQSVRSQPVSKHKHARDCQSSLFRNELAREKEAARFRAQQASEEPAPKPKLLKPKKDTVIPMMIPSSSVAPEMYIMRRPNAWMRRKFAHPHRRVSPTSGRIVDHPAQAVSSVNEVARYVEYNKVQDPMLNHAAYIEAHRARVHKIVRNRRGGSVASTR